VQAFNFYDTSGDGAIDKIEFRSMLTEGSLLKVKLEEIDDYFSQIDKDGGGDVDFEEFFSWFNFEWSKDEHGKVDKMGAAGLKKKKAFACSKIIPAKQRGINRLVNTFEEDKLEDDFGAKLERGKVEKDVGAGVDTIEGANDDRWWLTSSEQLDNGGWTGYKERKVGKVEFAVERKRKMTELQSRREHDVEVEVEHAAKNKEAITHEDFAAHKEEKIAEMKRKLEDRAKTPEPVVEIVEEGAEEEEEIEVEDKEKKEEEGHEAVPATINV